MSQKIIENLPVLIALAIVIFALYSCAFRRVWRERSGKKQESCREKLFLDEDADLDSRHI